MIAFLLCAGHLTTSSSLPEATNPDIISTSEALSSAPELDPRSSFPHTKRKGGGGGRGSGGGSSRSSGSSGGGGRGGGQTRVANPAYGGAKVPYAAGAPTPSRGRLPLLAPIAAFAFFPGIWLYGSLYAYSLGTPYYYRDPTTNRNQTVDVTCLCQENSECGCDDDGNTTFIQQVIGNGTDRPVNTSQVVVLPMLANGTQRAYINGTLPDDTTAADEVPNAALRLMASYGGYWVMLVTVLATVLSL